MLNGLVALLSVYEKTGIVAFARELVELGFTILASGGTAKCLDEAGIPVTDVATVVGDPILGHRVVTLSREVHAGLLAREEDREELERLGIAWIDLVCVDLYPLMEEIARPGATRTSVIDKTDIGGPTMLRSAAKGRRIVVCDPTDREMVIDWLKSGRPDEDALLTDLTAKAEYTVAKYCLASARYHSQGEYDGMIGRRVDTCKYGENAYQTPAALFTTDSDDQLALNRFRLVAGAAPSYNNRCDQDRLLQTVSHVASAFAHQAHRRGNDTLDRIPNIAIGVKHGNACGAGIANRRDEALRLMIDGDRRALHGGLVMTNFDIGEEEAELLLSYGMTDRRRLLDGVFATRIREEAVALLKRKGDKCRFLEPTMGLALNEPTLDRAPRFRYVRGGFLRQPNYEFALDLEDPRLEKCGDLTPALQEDLLFAWALGSTMNSNTIVLVKGGQLIGAGVGQQDRVGAAELAVKRAQDAGHTVDGAVAYSDSFFPFPDGALVLAKAGIAAVLTSSGSINDAAVKEACLAHRMIPWFIPDGIGRGFFGH